MPASENPPKNPPQLWWRCPNCGQTYFGEDPPDMCDFCQDFTTWQPYQPREERTTAPRIKPPVQLRLL